MDKLELGFHLRNTVVGANTQIPLANGEYVTAINFDNAATTPPFCAVMREINRFAPWYSSIHRGKGYKSVLSSELYEEGRKVIAGFVKADLSRDVIIYTKNTTESINMLSYILFDADEKQIILATDMEHLANDLPWRDKFAVDYVSINEAGKLSLADLTKKLQHYQGKIKLVTVTGASNVSGIINPIDPIARLVHRHGAKLLVDGAQLVPHCPVDMKPHDSPEHIDYLVFSAHKMYAPFGAGVLIGPQATFEQAVPVYQGGGDVKLVSRQFVEWADPPARHEAGTPNVMGVAALITAIQTLQNIGMKAIHQYEENLICYALAGLRRIPGLTLYGCGEPGDERVSLLSFNIEGIHHKAVAAILSGEGGIAVRSGLFCAHPYAQKLLKLTAAEVEYCRQHLDSLLPGMVRMSLGLYNNYREVDRFLELLEQIVRDPTKYQKKYRSLIRYAAADRP
ncbi:MAG: aminotransferase class V-fold PLP-dependent enzyme [Veillonellales bacterium]